MSNDSKNLNATESPLQHSADAQPSFDPNQPLWEGTFSARGMVHWFLSLLILTVLILLAVAVPEQFRRDTSAWLIGIIAIVVLWLVYFVVLKLRQWSQHYRLCETTLEIETGILSRQISPISLLFVTDVKMQQTILERIFNVGKIEIYSTDRTDPTRKMIGISDPRRVYGLIRNQWNLMVRRRGIMTSAAAGMGGTGDDLGLDTGHGVDDSGLGSGGLGG